MAATRKTLCKKIREMGTECKLSEEKVYEQLNKIKQETQFLGLRIYYKKALELACTNNNHFAVQWIIENAREYPIRKIKLHGCPDQNSELQERWLYDNACLDFDDFLPVDMLYKIEHFPNHTKIFPALFNDHNLYFNRERTSVLLNILFRNGWIDSFLKVFKQGKINLGRIQNFKYPGDKTLATITLESVLKNKMTSENALAILEVIRGYVSYQRKDLALAIQTNNILIVRFVLNMSRPGLTDDRLNEEKDGVTPLELALSLKFSEMAQYLFEAGAWVNKVSGLFNKTTHSPLLKKMADKGDIFAVKELLKLGARPAFNTEYSVLPLKEYKETSGCSEQRDHKRVSNFLQLLNQCLVDTSIPLESLENIPTEDLLDLDKILPVFKKPSLQKLVPGYHPKTKLSSRAKERASYSDPVAVSFAALGAGANPVSLEENTDIPVVNAPDLQEEPAAATAPSPDLPSVPTLQAAIAAFDHKIEALNSVISTNSETKKPNNQDTSMTHSLFNINAADKPSCFLVHLADQPSLFRLFSPTLSEQEIVNRQLGEIMRFISSAPSNLFDMNARMMIMEKLNEAFRKNNEVARPL